MAHKILAGEGSSYSTGSLTMLPCQTAGVTNGSDVRNGQNGVFRARSFVPRIAKNATGDEAPQDSIDTQPMISGNGGAG